MGLAGPIDAMFLLTESRAHPMHVGSLLLFEPPMDAGRDFARGVYEALVTDGPVDALFRTRPTRLFGATRPWWTVDAGVDLSTHVQRWALPGPGGDGELFDLASQLHSTPLDPARPLWELHLIEGLGDGRLGVYVKIHHALADGVAAMRLLHTTLTPDPDAEGRVPWRLPRSSGPGRADHTPPRVPAHNLPTLGMPSPATALRAAQAAVSLRQLLAVPAPRTVFNVPIGPARRCAARSWSPERIAQIGKATGASGNDVILAVCAGGLRDYLLERHALPDRSLVAMVPVSLRPTDRTDSETSGNQLAVLLCPPGTDYADPLRRLEVIAAATARGKQFYRSLPATVATALSGLLLSPLAAAQLRGIGSWTPPPFNLVISNVPRPRETLYWHGARLDACHPLSIPMHGLAVNITVAGTATSIDIGITGCRAALPDPARLLEHLDRSLTALEDHC